MSLADSLQLSQSSSARSQGSVDSTSKTAGGYVGTVVNNFSLGGSKLSSSLTSADNLPEWIWYAGAGLALVVAIKFWKH